MKRGKRQNRLIKLLVTAIICVVVAVSIIVLNVFVPVIYLPAYINFTHSYNTAGVLRISYLDVGFGDCIFIELPDGKSMLIDGGNGLYSNNYNILKTLNRSGVKQLDYLVCTSFKSEHSGGLGQIVKYKKPKTVYMPQTENIYITRDFSKFYGEVSASPSVKIISQYGEGVYSQDYGYFFCFLSPSAISSGESEYDKCNALPNDKNIDNASAVMWLQYGGYGFMFLGDAGADVQNKIAKFLYIEGKKVAVGNKLFDLAPCAGVKIANHCKEGYVDALLLDILSPGFAVISSGDNRQGCPSAESLAYVGLYAGENIYRTDINGCITVTVGAEGYSVNKERI